MKNILLIDDESEILETIVESFEIAFEGKELSVASSLYPVKALETFKENNNYDLVITDLKMPVMTGIELSEKIRGVNKDTPIIVFTGHGDAKEMIELNRIGITKMIKKPNIKELIESVGSILEF